MFLGERCWNVGRTTWTRGRRRPGLLVGRDHIQRQVRSHRHCGCVESSSSPSTSSSKPNHRELLSGPKMSDSGSGVVIDSSGWCRKTSRCIGMGGWTGRRWYYKIGCMDVVECWAGPQDYPHLFGCVVKLQRNFSFICLPASCSTSSRNVEQRTQGDYPFSSRPERQGKGYNSWGRISCQEWCRTHTQGRGG